jgi:hypothetical protein
MGKPQSPGFGIVRRRHIEHGSTSFLRHYQYAGHRVVKQALRRRCERLKEQTRRGLLTSKTIQKLRPARVFDQSMLT